MAIIHRAEITPTKAELLAEWVPTRPWAGATGPLEVVAAYRLDDPEGSVGIECHLVRLGERLLHVPVTYRDAPLAGADDALITRMEHTVLGTRWVYDGCADPVFADRLVFTIVAGLPGATQERTVDGVHESRATTAQVAGTGAAGTSAPVITEVTCADDGPTTVVTAGDLRMVVLRQVPDDATGSSVPTGAPALVGTWPGSPSPRPLAYLPAAADGP